MGPDDGTASGRGTANACTLAAIAFLGSAAIPGAEWFWGILDGLVIVGGIGLVLWRIFGPDWEINREITRPLTIKEAHAAKEALEYLEDCNRRGVHRAAEWWLPAEDRKPLERKKEPRADSELQR